MTRLNFILFLLAACSGDPSTPPEVRPSEVPLTTTPEPPAFIGMEEGDVLAMLWLEPLLPFPRTRLVEGQQEGSRYYTPRHPPEAEMPPSIELRYETRTDEGGDRYLTRISVLSASRSQWELGVNGAGLTIMPTVFFRAADGHLVEDLPGWVLGGAHVPNGAAAVLCVEVQTSWRDRRPDRMTMYGIDSTPIFLCPSGELLEWSPGGLTVLPLSGSRE